VVLKDAEEGEGRMMSWLESDEEGGIFVNVSVELRFEFVCLLCLVVFGVLVFHRGVGLTRGEACVCGEVSDGDCFESSTTERLLANPSDFVFDRGDGEAGS
jgi:hypothetical protein